MAVADKLSQGEEAFLARTERVKVKQVRRVRVPKARVAPEQPVELEQTFDITRPLEEAVEALKGECGRDERVARFVASLTSGTRGLVR